MRAMLQQITAGDTLKFEASVPDYPASDGWTLKYRLIPRTSGTPIDITAATGDDGESYEVAVAASTTATWTPGPYSWAAWVELGADKFTVDGWPQTDGVKVDPGDVVTILADPRTAATYDSRSVAQKALDDCKAALAAYNASRGLVKSYTIAGRSMTFRDGGDIVLHMDYWQRQVDNERTAESLAKGLGNPRHMRVRFAR